MFNDLMKEVNAKKKQEISAKNVNVQANTNLTAKQQQKKEQDEIEDMLAGLWFAFIYNNSFMLSIRCIAYLWFSY